MRTLTTLLSVMVLAFTGMLAQADDHATPTQPVGMVYAMDVSDPPAFDSMPVNASTMTDNKVVSVLILFPLIYLNKTLRFCVSKSLRPCGQGGASESELLQGVFMTCDW